jgi:hypothetical protein
MISGKGGLDEYQLKIDRRPQYKIENGAQVKKEVLDREISLKWSLALNHF